MRQIVLDTETTGIDPKQGHRIVEIGAVEIEKRRLTGRTFHYYLNPDRIMDDEVMRIHGISNEFLLDKPRFPEVVTELMAFVNDAQVIIHNADFDVGHLNAELGRLSNNPWQRFEHHCTIIDSLAMAKKRYPGQRNSLDALCKRLGIDNSERTFHGALLDSEILADVYIAMTGGQEHLGFGLEDAPSPHQQQHTQALISQIAPFQVQPAQHQAHTAMLSVMQKKSCVWTERYPNHH